MPFVSIVRDKATIGDHAVRSLIDALREEVARSLSAHDPRHTVTAPMIDVQVIDVGPLDRIRAPVFITVLARHESARSSERNDIVDELRSWLDHQLAFPSVVELVLTHHTSSFDYSELE